MGMFDCFLYQFPARGARPELHSGLPVIWWWTSPILFGSLLAADLYF